MKRKWLAVGIILLFVGTCIIPAIAQDTRKPQSTPRGNWLYVGGDGPGNYTRIQDAINDSSDGDTVFVYHGIYYEHLRVTKDILLIGEEKDTTYIDGEGKDTIIYLGANVNLTEFTIQNGETAIHALNIPSGTYSFIVYANVIKNCNTGIDLGTQNRHLITKNNITHNNLGIWLFRTFGSKITHNNFIDNEKHASFDFLIFYQVLLLHYNNWNGNYWDDWQVRVPRPIRGSADIMFVFFTGATLIPIYPWIAFDWQPAQEPYDIGGI